MDDATIAFIGVVIGGLITALSNVILFDMARRKEKEQDEIKRRNDVLQSLARSEIKSLLFEGGDTSVTSERINQWAAEAENYSDAQISAYLGAAEAYDDYLESQRIETNS